MSNAWTSIGTGLALALSVASCGSSDAGWMDSGMFSCPSKDWDEIQKDKSNQSNVGGMMCGKQGKAYAGEWRCKDTRVQVKCK